MTEKLYYIDSHLHEFTARVLSCVPWGEGYALTLDRTAFFPEGGGQPGDSGRVGPARVLDTHEKDGEVLHYTDMAFEPGTEVACAVDWEQRLRRMQNHSGEHIVSGIAHKLHGVENVGFHMGEECMTVDFDAVLSWEELMRIEQLANEAVRANVPVRATFPTRTELAALDYRSKLELTENVRIVAIEGIDLCACCAPHVSRTGEIGVIKILDAQKHRGGVRISILCGMDAIEDYRRRQEDVTAVSRLLSAKRDGVPGAVERLLGERDGFKARAAELSLRAVELMAESFPCREGNICVFDDLLDEIALRELVNRLVPKCTGLAAVFFPAGEGWRYIIGSGRVDLRANARAINAGISGRGGGSPVMIQGQAFGSEADIRSFIEAFNV